MKNVCISITYITLLIAVFVGCRRSDGDVGVLSQSAAPHLTIGIERLQFGPYEETRTFAVDTNAENVNIVAPGWLTVTNHGNGRVSARVAANTGNERSGAITLTIPQTDSHAEQSVTLRVIQHTSERPAFYGIDDVKVPVASGTASEQRGNDGIERTFDGDLETYYHSPAGRPARFPLRLTYKFPNVPQIDQMRYYIHSGTNNGRIGNLEIWVAESGGELKKQGNYNFNQGNAQVYFDPPLRNPTTVELRVLSGRNNFVVAAELEFYRREFGDFDYLTIFTDTSASTLRSHVTRETIDNIPNEFFKDLALRIFLGIHDPDAFRIQEYRAWISPRVDGAANKTNQLSIHDNPTGIYVKAGEELIAFAGDLQGQNVQVFSVDLTTGSGGERHYYRLVQGLNRITPHANGLLYIEYFTEQYAAAPKIPIHFVTGEINGYFDSQKHKPEDWRRFLENAVAPDFDLVGVKTHLTFPVSGFKERTPDGKALIDQWDELARLQHEFMGLYKYDRVYRNRLYGHGDYRQSVYMYAANQRMGFAALGAATQVRTIHLPTFIGNPFGAAHEAGHMHQVRPGLRWRGMGEVTVNLYTYVTASHFNGGNLMSRVPRAQEEFIGKDVPHNNLHHDFAVIPMWQIKLYLENALGQTDFYKDLHYYYMTNPDPGTGADTDGRFQLHYVRKVCEIANLDLTRFFELWGFLTPVEKDGFVITQAQIDAVKAEIARYPRPPIEDFTGITDHNILDYTPDHLASEMRRVLAKVEEANALLALHKTARSSAEVYAFETYVTPEERNALLFVANRARQSSPSVARQMIRELDNAMADFKPVVKRGTKTIATGTNIGQFYSSATAAIRATGAVSSSEAGGSSPRSVDHMMRNTGRWASTNPAPGTFPIDVTINFDEPFPVDSMTIFAFQSAANTQGRIQNFDIDYWNGSEWVNCYQRRSTTPIPGNTGRDGTNGYRAAFTGGAVKSDRFRLAILSSNPIDPSIWHIQLHYRGE